MKLVVDGKLYTSNKDVILLQLTDDEIKILVETKMNRLAGFPKQLGIAECCKAVDEFTPLFNEE